MIGEMERLEPAECERAQANLALLFDHVMKLYTCGDSSSISTAEAYELMRSICFVMGVNSLEDARSVRVLARGEILQHWRERCDELRKRADETMLLWRRLNEIMPPVRNISLRDTLLSLGSFKQRYDVVFAAHEVPCDIDYQLCTPVPDCLQGVDYVQAWLLQAIREAEYLAQFELSEIERILSGSCPDYVGLHINVYELVHRVKG